jgi:hypothetical protein
MNGKKNPRNITLKTSLRESVNFRWSMACTNKFCINIIKKPIIKKIGIVQIFSNEGSNPR